MKRCGGQTLEGVYILDSEQPLIIWLMYLLWHTSSFLTAHLCAPVHRLGIIDLMSMVFPPGQHESLPQIFVSQNNNSLHQQ